MIATSFPVKLLALVISASAFILTFTLFAPTTSIQNQGTPSRETAQFGTHFEDLIQGTVAPPPAQIKQAQKVQPTTVAETPNAAAPITSPQATVAATPKPAMAAKPVTIPAAIPAPVPVQKPGNAEQDTIKGTEAGSGAGKTAAPKATTHKKPASKSKAAGNSAVNNYPGKVMQALSKARKPRIRAKGAATVTFVIAASGALSKVRVTKTSGSKALDRAALKMIQSAAPFPPPPQGAQREFSIKIQGK